MELLQITNATELRPTLIVPKQITNELLVKELFPRVVAREGDVIVELTVKDDNGSILFSGHMLKSLWKKAYREVRRDEI